jgi:hypothetical protein
VKKGCRLGAALDQPVNHAMLEDVRALIAIRQREADVLGAAANTGDLGIRLLPYMADAPIATPYARYGQGKAVIVAGNYHTDRAVNLGLTLPLESLGLPEAARYQLTDLWQGDSWTVEQGGLASLPLTIPPDKVTGGGLRLIKVEPLD